MQDLKVLRPHKTERGFTLLEVLLVLVLMGLAASIVVPTVSTGNNNQQLETQARRFVLQAEMANRQALMDGRHYGFRLTDDGYRFVVWEAGDWLPINNDRFMTEVNLDELMTVHIRHGSSHWQAALEYESRNQSSLLEKDFAVVEKQERHEPDLYFWSSGEVSPAEIAFCFDDRQSSCWLVTQEESGEMFMDRES